MAIIEFKKDVVAAVDIRQDWMNVAEHAARFARFAGATLHLVHVVEAPHSSLRRAFGKKELSAHQKQLREESRARIDREAGELAKTGVPVDVTILEGRPWKEILESSDVLKAGLIVCGAGVTEGSEWLFVGTTADRLIRNSKVPVLVVGPRAPDRMRRIMVPTDLDRPDQGAIRIAAGIALETKGRVSILHAFAQPSVLHGYMGNVAALRREAKETSRHNFEDFVAETKLPKGAAAPHKLLKACSDHVDAAESIVVEASRLKMDLIVMALGGTTFLESFMIGAVAERVIRNLPCSLLALPTAWAKKR